MKIALDTDILWAYFMQDKAVADLVGAQTTVSVPATVVGELWSALRTGSRHKQNLTYFEEFLNDPAVEILPVGRDTAEIYARLEADVPATYRWTAALCVEHTCELATRDETYHKIAGLLTLSV